MVVSEMLNEGPAKRGEVHPFHRLKAELFPRVPRGQVEPAARGARVGLCVGNQLEVADGRLGSIVPRIAGVDFHARERFAVGPPLGAHELAIVPHVHDVVIHLDCDRGPRVERQTSPDGAVIVAIWAVSIDDIHARAAAVEPDPWDPRAVATAVFARRGKVQDAVPAGDVSGGLNVERDCVVQWQGNVGNVGALDQSQRVARDQRLLPCAQEQEE